MDSAGLFGPTASARRRELASWPDRASGREVITLDVYFSWPTGWNKAARAALQAPDRARADGQSGAQSSTSTSRCPSEAEARVRFRARHLA